MSDFNWIGELVTWLVLAGVLLWLAKLERDSSYLKSAHVGRLEDANECFDELELAEARIEALEASTKAERQARTTELAAKTHLARVPVVRTFTVGARGDAEERQADGRGPEVLP